MQVSYIDRIKGYLRFMKPEIRAEWRDRNKFIFNDKFRPIQKNRMNLFWTETFEGGSNRTRKFRRLFICNNR